MPLENLQRKQFMSSARRMLLDRMKGGGGYMGGATGPTIGGGAFSMSGSQPTAGESQAFNERNKNRAMYGKYGQGGFEREKMGMSAGLAREGFGSAEKIAKTRADSWTGAAKIRGETDRDVQGMRGRSAEELQAMQGKTARDVAGIQQRPQFHYGERKDQMGATTGFDVFKDGELMQGKGGRPGEMNWAKGLKEDQFPQAGEVLKRKMEQMSPEEIASFQDEVFRTNPALGQYLMEAEQTRGRVPQYKMGPNDKDYKVSIGDYLAKRAKEQATLPFRLAKKPFELGKKLLGAEMPEWLR